MQLRNTANQLTQELRAALGLPPGGDDAAKRRARSQAIAEIKRRGYEMKAVGDEILITGRGFEQRVCDLANFKGGAR